MVTQINGTLSVGRSVGRSFGFCSQSRSSVQSGPFGIAQDLLPFNNLPRVTFGAKTVHHFPWKKTVSFHCHRFGLL